jgi:hypothetical protein
MYQHIPIWGPGIFFLQIGIFGLKPSGNPEDKHTHDGVLQLAMKKMARMWEKAKKNSQKQEG